MCGISGILAISSAVTIDQLLLKDMSMSLAHRGPDSEGFYCDEHVAFAFRRLSIIDLNTGDQPLSNEDGSIWVVFNGEIYNFQELRRLLKKMGHRFHTCSDTEAIVHAYEQFGPDCVQYFRGMFAFAIWDKPKRQLFLARDRLGKKPLYYFSDGRQFAFSSELKALLKIPELSGELDFTALDHYLTYQYIPAPQTILSSVRKLPPGHRMMISAETGSVDVESYWSVSYEPKLQLTLDEASEQIRNTITDAVRMRMISDVPLGALLSGGIDSSIVVGIMAQLSNRRVKTYSIGFEETCFNELPFARRVAQIFSTDHHEFIVRPNIADVISDIVYYLDEPLADPSAVPTYYVAQMARKHVTVVLNGDGGDESFAGYHIYGAVMKWLRLARLLPDSLVGGLLKPLLKRIPQTTGSSDGILAKGRTFLDIRDFSLAEHFLRQETVLNRAARTSLYTKDALGELNATPSAEDYLLAFFTGKQFGALDQMLNADINCYLPGDLLVKMDRMSMAHSLEARSPLLDQEVVALAALLPERYKRTGDKGKLILRRAFFDLLPADIWSKPKQGFAVPLAQWLREPLRDMANDVLTTNRATQRGLFRRDTIQKLLSEHQRRHADRSHAIWALLILELWLQTFID